MTEEPDSILVIRCQLGESAAWECLVHRWHPRLWRFVLGMLGNRASAEDVLQNIWIRVVRSLVRLREPEKLESWMYRIARIVIADRFREHYRRPVPEVFVDAASVNNEQEVFELTDSIRSALTQLHPMDRESVVLYYLEEKTMSQVAAICEVPEGTVKSRLHRARGQLREILKSENE
jgi:RNA polymerase sigma factor (sigma-70 family)